MANTNLPPDPVQMEQTIASRIRDTFLSVPLIAQYANVEARERFPDSDERDIAISTKPDPNNPSSLLMTSLIQIGIPTVEENIYTDENNTQLTFVYPISFDMSVVDEWDNSDGALEYTNSRALFMAIYMYGRKAFKTTPDNKPNKDLGFNNCVHDYLQQENVGTVLDEESGGYLHVADWSLTVHVTGVLT